MTKRMVAVLVAMAALYGLAVAPTPARADITGGYVLDAWGGIHPWGGAPTFSSNFYQPGKDIARAIALNDFQTGEGYVLDGWGGIHAFGGAPVTSGPGYTPGQSTFTAFVLNDDASGYKINSAGQIYPFGANNQLLAGTKVGGAARHVDIELSNFDSGYVLDVWGGIHNFEAAPGEAPDVSSSFYQPGKDIARALAFNSDGSGYVLDAWGGIHPFGDAPVVSTNLWQPGNDIARDILLVDDAVGYVLDAWGGLHPFGGAPAEASALYQPGKDIARSVA